MHAEPTAVLKILSDPTRRAIFERLSKGGEMTVHALTDPSGVSQPAISKHLRRLRLQVNRPPISRQLEAGGVEEKDAETIRGPRAQYGTYP